MRNDALMLEKEAIQRLHKQIDYQAAEAKLELAAMAHAAILAINRRAGQRKRRLLERLAAA